MNSKISNRFLLAIPAFNCETQIGRVLDSLVTVGNRFDEIWVIDNRSTDETAEVALSRRPLHSNLRVFVNDTNVNLGGTHKIVFQKATEKGFSHVLIMHGDDQASSADIPGMLEACNQHGGTTVLGSRFMLGSNLDGYDFKRIAGNLVLNSIYSLFVRRKLSDLGSGLNLFELSALEPETYMNFGNSLTFNYELLLDLVNRKVLFNYVPIHWKETDQVSNARNWNIFWNALRILFSRWSAKERKSESRGEITWTELS